MEKVEKIPPSKKAVALMTCDRYSINCIQKVPSNPVKSLR